jgi:glucosamine--fructose-6-phosphate aminotransferase (isomerizing)
LGYGKGCNFVASDATAIIEHTREVAYMEDGEVAVVTKEAIKVFNSLGEPVEKKHAFIDWDISAAEKGGYAHFMFKEIMEQPEAIRKTMSPRIRGGRIVFDGLKIDEKYIKGINKIFIVACGSSYHVGVVGKYNLEKLLRIPVEPMLASEFRYCDPLVTRDTLVIVISQSGETLDTMAALREAKSRGAHILSIVNVVGSSIARESDDVLYTWAGPGDSRGHHQGLFHSAGAAGHAWALLCRHSRHRHLQGVRRRPGRAPVAARKDGDGAQKHRRHQISGQPLL